MAHANHMSGRVFCERKIVFIGFGSIGQALIAPLFNHFDISPDQVAIITGDDRGQEIAQKFSVAFHVAPLTKANYQLILTPYVDADTFVINVSVDVSTYDIIEFCQTRGALYVDTVIEPWAGRYTDSSISPDERSNYALREEMMSLRSQSGPHSPTAILTHGANPGLVSHFVKQALLNIAADTQTSITTPQSRSEWTALAQQLGIKVIHIAERDSQLRAARRQPGEFTNTWSVDGFIGEGLQPAELGWGSHEKTLPIDARQFDSGCQASIYLDRPGLSTRIRSYSPLSGPQTAFLVTHGESISIADYFTSRDAGGTVVYRPTVLYAYHPNDDTILSILELQERGWIPQEHRTVITSEIESGIDALGVLLMGQGGKSYWYGSFLSVEEARQLAPHNNATSLQVVAGILSAVEWALGSPTQGIVEPDEIPYDQVLNSARPYLGNVFGKHIDWTPLHGRSTLFTEDIDAEDPWQFKNFRIN
jgi:homospermidine synthase